MRKFLGLMVLLFLLVSHPFKASAVISLLDGDIKLDGYMRTWLQMWTDHGQAANFADFRGTLQLEGQFKFTENTLLVAILRGTRESLGNYSRKQGVPDDYFDENFDDCVRELYLEIKYPGLTIRAGRQQVIWGETDFFRTADIINPIDFSWRSFLEDWQDIRIPNWMLFITKEIPDSWGRGAMEFIWKPGIDDAEDVVDKFAPTGAPWAIRPGPPAPLPVALSVEYPGKGLTNGSGGIRYLNQFSMLGRFFNYSLNYYYGWQEGPVADFRGIYIDPVLGPVIDLGLKYKRARVIGATLNFSIDELESVVRVEAGYWKDRGYNFDTNKADLRTRLNHPEGFLTKDLLRYSVGWDWTPSQWWTKWGSRQAWMYSIQLFQDFIIDYDEDEYILRTAGYPPRQHELETVITFFCNGHYWFDRIQPGFAAGYDIRGSWMWIPSCNFIYGDHWRAKIEWDGFNGKKYNNIGYLSSNDMLCLKLTYQF